MKVTIKRRAPKEEQQLKPAKTTTTEQHSITEPPRRKDNVIEPHEPKARKKTQHTPKWVEEAEQQPLHGQVGHVMKAETVSIVAEISEFKGTLRLDLREHQQSPEYTGPTKRGINIDTEMFMDLYNLMTKVKDRLEMHGQLQE